MASVQAATFWSGVPAGEAFADVEGFRLGRLARLRLRLGLTGFAWPIAGAGAATPTETTATTQTTARAILPKQPRIAFLTPAATRLPQPFRSTAPK